MRAMKRAPLMLVIVAGTVLGLAVLFYVATHSGYDSRRYVSEAIKAAESLKARVVSYHESKKALPKGGEAQAFRAEVAQLDRVRAIEWDASREMVVITMDGTWYPGKRFGFVAEIREGRIEWVCRPIDIEAKHLPAACR